MDPMYRMAWVEGEGTLLRLHKDGIICMDSVLATDMNHVLSESMVRFLRDKSLSDYTYHDTGCGYHSIIHKGGFITTVTDREGSVRYPTWGKNRSCPETSWREWSSPPPERLVTPDDECATKVDGVDFTGCCKMCLKTGKWGLSYGDISSSTPDDPTIPKLTCFRGCIDCVYENRFVWGKYCERGEDIFIDIHNYGPIEFNYPWDRGGYRRLTKEASVDGLISRIANAIDYEGVGPLPPCGSISNWTDVFRMLPPGMRHADRPFSIWDIFPECRHLDSPLSSDITGRVFLEKIRMAVAQMELEYAEAMRTSTEAALNIEEEEEESEEEEEEEDEREDSEEDVRRKNNASQVLQIIEGIMDTKDQKLDQGSYLELCGLLRDLHQG